MAEKSVSAIVQESTSTTAATLKSNTPSILYASGSNSGNSGSNSNSSNKPDIKVSADGVAKLSFNFLEEFQGGDSSLEPGEVVTPPHSISPVPALSNKASIATKTPSRLAVGRSVSQTEAQVCEEKVRAILELDAIKRREELEKRKQDLEKRRQSGELEREEEEKRKAKAERKRIKKIEKEQRAARLALMSDDTDDGVAQQQQNCTRNSEDRESGERVSTSEEEEGADESPAFEGEQNKHAGVNSVAVLASSTSIYHPPLPTGHLTTFPDTYGNAGFRPMNMFPRNIRPDFHHSRGGYLPRGRGGRIGNSMRFPIYRAPFYGGNTGGSVQLRTHGPPHSQRASLAARGNSPIAADIEVKWTRTQPPVSYSMKWNPESKPTKKGKKNIESSSTSVSKSGEETERSTKSKKALKKSRKKTKKEKKVKSREKHKRSSRSKNTEKSRLRKIAKIRKTFENRSVSKTEPGTEKRMHTPITINEFTPKPFEVEESKERSVISTENVQIKNDCLAAMQAQKQTELVSEPKSSQSFDIFAESPPHSSHSKSVETTTPIEDKIQSTRRSCTPPIELLRLPAMKSDPLAKEVEKTPLQRAIEMQQRIGKLLQDDDLKLETLEATKEKLLQTTNKLSNPSSVVATSSNASSEKKKLETPKKREQTKETVEHQSHDKCENANGASKYVNPFRRSVSREKDSKRRRSHGDRNSPSSQNKVFRSSRGNRSRSRAESPSRNRTRSRERPRSKSTTRSKSRNRDTSKRREDHPSKDRESKRKVSKSPFRTAASVSGTRHKSRSRERKISKFEPKEVSGIQHKSTSREHKISTSEMDKNSVGSEKSSFKKRSISEHGRKQETKPKKVRQTKHTPLSFNASEFLFPDADENSDEGDIASKGENKQSNQSSIQLKSTLMRNVYEDDDTTASSSLPNAKCSNASNKRSSPDTDDYMDNWELDDPDSSNTAAEPAVTKTAVSLETSDEVTDQLLARFKNPSPQNLNQSSTLTQLESQPQSTITINKNEGANTSLTYSTPPLPSKSIVTLPSADSNDAGVNSSTNKSELANNEQFPMQDIYNEFIKSVEATGVDITPSRQIAKPTNRAPNVTSPIKRATKRNLSTSSSSSNSSSTSNSSASSSGSSDSSASCASPATSVGLPDKNNVNDAQTKTEPTVDKPEIEVQPEKTDPLSADAENVSRDSIMPTKPATPIATSQNANMETISKPDSAAKRFTNNGVEFISSTDPVEVLESVLPALPTETQEAQIAKDLKRVKSYDANLKRTQMMRANFDSSEDIFSELAKMEKLFLHAIKFIIQKYTNGREVSLQMDGGNISKPKFMVALSTSVPQIEVVSQASNKLNGQFVPSLRETASIMPTPNVVTASLQTNQSSSLEEQTTTTSEVVNIFDSNRETIKLTIAPLKLTKTSAIFDKLDKPNDDATRSRSSSLAAGDDADFTETLIKTTKEIAIVKPMSKDTRSPSPRRSGSRRLSPRTARPQTPRNSRGRRSNSRSGSAYRNNDYRFRRSNSRSRHGAQRRGQPKTLSISPQRREGHLRHESPKRRGKNTSPIRYRSGERRSRSPLRRSKRDLSPLVRRRRQAGTNIDARGARFCDIRSYSRSRSRSRSPHRFGNRPHGPRIPHSMHRRSYSRDIYSRSPLPFKPPSPPMRQSPELIGDKRRSLSGTPGRCRRSRSFSHSPTSPRKAPRSPIPRSRSPRSPRSPVSPRSPSSPRSPRSPRPHTPPGRYEHNREGSYEFRAHSPQEHSYYSVQHSMGTVDPAMGGSTPASTSDYYYDASPSHMSLGMVMNGPEAGQRNQVVYNTYESNYNQYDGNVTGGYLQHEIPSNHGTTMETGSGSEYYENHFMSPAATNNMMMNPMTQPMYSAGMPAPNVPHQSFHPPSRPNSYYFNNQVPVHMQPHQSRQLPQNSSLLKELPKATIAVQKGNVLEIVPNEMPHAPAVAPCLEKVVTVKTEPALCSINTKTTKAGKPMDPVKEEIIKRLETSAKLKETRKASGESISNTSILKKASTQHSVSESGTQSVSVKEEPGLVPTRKQRKKVLFEDGLFPNRDSDDEDSKDAERMLRLNVRRMRKMGRKAATVLYLLSTRKSVSKQKPTMTDLAKLPPPPPPPNQPLPHLEQPVSNRPPTPPRFIFYHYDAVVHALYTSPSEQGVPPRLTDPKAAAVFAASKAAGIGAMIRPRCSPIFAMKRDAHPSSINTLKLIGSNHLTRGSASPQMSHGQFYGSRRGNISFHKHHTQPYQQQPYNSSHQHQHHQRYSNNETPISTLSTQPLSQPKLLHKPVVATFQPIKPNSPQMPVTLATGQIPQHVTPQTPPVCFPNNIDVRAMTLQHPPVFSLPPLPSPHPGGMVNPRGFHPSRLMYTPNMSQTQILPNGPAASPSIPQMRQQHPQPQSYAYQPYVPQSPIRPAATQKNPMLTQQPRPAQQFNVFP